MAGVGALGAANLPAPALGGWEIVGRLQERLRPGISVLVKYHGHALYHERVLLGAVDDSLSTWAIVTPDDDVYLEDISVPPLDDIKLFTDRLAPPGIEARNMYLFNPPLTAEAIEGMAPRVMGLLVGERRRLGLPPMGPSAPVPAPAAAVEGARAASVVVAGGWYLAEPVGDVPIGTEVNMPGNFNPLQSLTSSSGSQSALVELFGNVVRVQRMPAGAVPTWAASRRMQLGAGAVVPGTAGPPPSSYAVQVPSATPEAEAGAGESGLAAFRAALAARRGGSTSDPVAVERAVGSEITSSDARTLPILVDRTGERWRDFANVVTKVQFSEVDNWPLEGPRTSLWVIKFVARNGGSFQGRHTKWVSENRLERSDPLVQEHDTISEVMDWLCCVDQLDVSNLVGAESLLRKYQLIEEIKTTKEEPGTEEHAYFKGKIKTLHGACICPELSSWVAERIKSDNEILKQRSRATELRGLDPKTPPAKKK